jgi:L-aminopeptidase/D-esterase-like protein
VQATEEAVINCLVAGQTMIGRDDHRSPALPVHRLPEFSCAGVGRGQLTR